MSKRLQVILSDQELAEFQAVARANDLTLSEWVRTSLREAGRRRTPRYREGGIEAIRRAARYEFPAPDIEQMLAEIESGYGPPT
jgi:post-segregation antitoxin (ccd killing protein)